MQAAGYCPDVDPDALTHALSGAMNELALWAAKAPDTRMDQAKAAARSLLSHG